MKELKELSPSNKKSLDFLRRFIREKDYPPSIRDIQEECGDQLHLSGGLQSESAGAHGLHPARPGGVAGHRAAGGSGRRPRTIAVPVVGHIAAGQPIPVPEESVDYSETVEVTRGDDSGQGKRLRAAGQGHF